MKKVIGTERQKDRKTERQKDRKTERQKDRKTERQKEDLDTCKGIVFQFYGHRIAPSGI
jgi:hypothetical protein